MERALRLSLTVLLLTLAACGDDPTTPSAPPADMTTYAQTMPAWDSFAEIRADSDALVEGTSPVDSLVQTGSGELHCTFSEYELAATPARMVVFNPDTENLWLGGLLQGDGYKRGLGALEELPIRQRAPLTITINLLTANNTRTVQTPDAASVNQAIGDLIEAASLAGHRAGSSFAFDQTTSYSFEQSSLRLGVSARFIAGSVAASLSVEQQAETNALTAYFIQEMFTTAIVRPQTPSELFSEEFTQQRLSEQIEAGNVGPDNPPVYVGSIVWGRMLMVTMTSTYSRQEMQAALNATRGSLGGGSVDAAHLEVLQASEIRVRGVGGDTDGVDDLIKTGQLAQYFDTAAPLTTARPISYTVYDLASGDRALVTEATRYTRTECEVQQGPVTGGRYRVTLLSLRLIADGCDGVFSPSPEVYYRFWIGTDAGLGDPVANRTAGNAVTLGEGSSLTLNAAKEVDLYADGRGQARVYGFAWDYDTDSSDEEIGAWDITYRHGVSNGTRYFTRSANGCSIRLYLDVQRTADLYD